MCRQSHSEEPRVCLFQCEHGTFHLSIDQVTLHVTDKELTLIGQAISRWAQQHPEWVRHLLSELKESGSL